MEVEKLYEMLKKAQEAKGYFFNKDKERVFELLQALILNQGTLWLYGLSLQISCRRPQAR